MATSKPAPNGNRRSRTTGYFFASSKTHPDEGLVPPYLLDVNTRQAIETGRGYELLGLFEEARAQYQSVPEEDLSWIEAQRRLVGIDMSQEKMIEAADRGMRLAQMVPDSRTVIFDAALAQHHAGRPQAAYDLLMARPDLFGKEGQHAYAIACYAAPIGEIDFALQALFFSFRPNEDYREKSFLDPDIQPIWVAGAAGKLNLNSALVLAHPLMTKVVSAVSFKVGEIPIDYVMKPQVPDECRPFLEVDPVTGLYSLAAQAPEPTRDRYLRWQQEYKARTLGLARVAIEKAKEMVLDLQLEWATAKARKGHLIGARYHVLFALAHRPQALDHFETALRPLGMGYLFDELIFAAGVDSRFPSLLERITSETNAGNLNEAGDLLDSLAPNLQSLTLGLIRRAALEDRRENHHFALRTWLEVARRWPDDAVGFGNGIDALIAAEKWAQARKLYDRAPESYRKLALADGHRVQLENQNMRGPSYGGDDFYGQPHWDDRLTLLPVPSAQPALHREIKTFWAVRVLDLFHYMDKDEESLIEGFSTMEAAIEYARRRTRDSLEEVRPQSQGAENLKRLWFTFGEDAVVVGGSYSGGQEIDFFIKNPASAKERDWISLEPNTKRIKKEGI